MTEKFTIKVDGYSVGERLLEGAFFDAEVEADDWFTARVLSVKIQPQYADYFKQLNEAYWLQQVKEHVENDPYTFIFEDDEICPNERFEELQAKWGAPDFDNDGITIPALTSTEVFGL